MAAYHFVMVDHLPPLSGSHRAILFAPECRRVRRLLSFVQWRDLFSVVAGWASAALPQLTGPDQASLLYPILVMGRMESSQ